MTGLQALVNVTGIFGLVLSVGVLAFWLLAWPEGRRAPEISRLAWMGSAALFAAGIAQLVLRAVDDHLGFSELLATRSGTVLAARIALLCLAYSWLKELDRTYAARRYRAMNGAVLAVGAVIFLALPATWALSVGGDLGSWAALKVILAIVYLLACVSWLGALTVLGRVWLARRLGRRPAGEMAQLLLRVAVVVVVGMSVAVLSSSAYLWLNEHRAPAEHWSAFAGVAAMRFGALVIVPLLAALLMWVHRHRVGPAGRSVRQNRMKGAS